MFEPLSISLKNVKFLWIPLTTTPHPTPPKFLFAFKSSLVLVQAQDKKSFI